MSYAPADANLDGIVDGADFLVWNAHKFTSRSYWSHGDFNADGAVDGQDFLIWNQQKFAPVAPQLGAWMPSSSEYEEPSATAFDLVFAELGTLR